MGLTTAGWQVGKGCFCSGVKRVQDGEMGTRVWYLGIGVLGLGA